MLISFHDSGLVDATAPYCLDQYFGLPRQEACNIFFEPVQENGIANEAIFDDFGNARAQLPVRQGIERGGVGNDRSRLVKGADHVLAQRMIDSGLAAHRRINLGQERGGNLNRMALRANRLRPQIPSGHPRRRHPVR